MLLTPARTLSISGLKSRVLKLSFLSLKMMVKSGLEFILKLTEPLQRYLLTCQANSALLGRLYKLYNVSTYLFLSFHRIFQFIKVLFQFQFYFGQMIGFVLSSLQFFLLLLTTISPSLLLPLQI